MKPGSQPARLLAWLRANPGASSLEITWATRIVNVTGRISDLRAAGYTVVCEPDRAGVKRYRLIEASSTLWAPGELMEAWGK